MVAIWIAGALLLGLAVSRIGLPPLVGFLASGFVFAALGMERAPLLGDLAHAGVLLLLFAVGLKLRIKTLLRYEVWGTAISHLLRHRHHRRRRGRRPAAGWLLAWRSRWPSASVSRAPCSRRRCSTAIASCGPCTAASRSAS